MRKALTFLLIFLLILAMLPVTALAQGLPASVPPQALPVSNWAIGEVSSFLENNLLPARLAERDFRLSINRADFSTLIMHAYPRLSGNPIFPLHGQASPFSDSDDADIIWASQLGIVSGTGQGQFSPQRYIYRSEIARMFHNLLAAMDAVPAIGSPTDLTTRFNDAHEIPYWAAESAALLVNMGIMQGSDGNFWPRRTATFEQAMLMINRLFAQINGSAPPFPSDLAHNVQDVSHGSHTPGMPGFIDHLDFPDLGTPSEVTLPQGVEELHANTVRLSAESESFTVPTEGVNRSLGFSWEAMAGATDYEVTVIMNRLSVAPVPIPAPTPSVQRTGGALQFTLSEVRPIKHYSVTVTGIDAAGRSVGQHFVEFWSSPAPRAVSREEIFFNGEGTTPEEKQAAARTITVPVWRLDERTGVRTSGTISFAIHHALADIMIEIFEEIYAGAEQFPIRDVHTLRPGSIGEHGRGTAIDINANENWYNCLRTGAIVGNFWRPYENPFSITPYGDVVTAFERHGFTWGGDSWRNVVDYMHFSYFGT